MLTSMAARTQGIRLLIQYAASLVDCAEDNENPSAAMAKVLLGILTPIAKAWCTEMAFDVASTGVQVFGGIGYNEECEASQCFREARVHMIYEGTTGIQANDLLFRKILRDSGAGIRALIEEIRASIEKKARYSTAISSGVGDDLSEMLRIFAELSEMIVGARPEASRSLQENGAHYLMFAGALLAGWLSMLAAEKSEDDVARLRNVRHIVDQCVKPAATLASSTLLSAIQFASSRVLVS
jgi:acyl-CoA dehydrogenase